MCNLDILLGIVLKIIPKPEVQRFSGGTPLQSPP